MKKKLLTILLTIFVMLMVLPTAVFADISTVDDVTSKASYLPIAERGDVPYKNSNGAQAYWYVAENPGLSFECEKGSVFLKYDVSVTPSGNNYVCTVDDITYTFYMTDDELSSISLSGSSVSELNGNYLPPEFIDAVDLSSLKIGEEYANITPSDVGTVIDAFETDKYEVYSHSFFTKNTSGTYAPMNDSDSFVAGNTYNFFAFLNAKDDYYFKGEWNDTKEMYLYSGTLTPNSNIVDKVVIENVSSNRSVIVGKCIIFSFDFIATNATKTIADILATVDEFPTSEDDAWLSEDGSKMYIVEMGPEYTTLKYGSYGLLVTNQLTKLGSDYTITVTNGDSLTFKMKNGILQKVVVEGVEASRDGNDGTYMPQDIAYEIIEGKKVTINAKDNKDYSYFTSDADFARFKEVKVDNKTITRDVDYTVKSGSTKVTLKADFIDSLDNGSHTLEIVSNNGSATTTFTITRNVEPEPSPTPKYVIPKTGVR